MKYRKVTNPRNVHIVDAVDADEIHKRKCPHCSHDVETLLEVSVDGGGPNYLCFTCTIWFATGKIPEIYFTPGVHSYDKDTGTEH